MLRGRLPQTLLGAILSLLAVLAGGEAYLRLAPPDDLRPYVIDRLSDTGPYVPDPVIGADYRSYAALHAIYPERLDQLAAENAGRPVWMLFGNSFVQAPGMLGDTAQARIGDIQFFYVQRNDILLLRVAQLRRLLEQGHRPRRVVFAVMPIDCWGIALAAPSDMAVNGGGALGRRNHAPPMVPSWLADNSWLVLGAWTRSGGNTSFPGYGSNEPLNGQPPGMAAEFDRLFGEIGRLAKAYGFAATILMIPDREQVMGDTRRAPQEFFSAAAARAGLDYADSTDAFLAQSDRAGLFIPDGHFNDRGNAVLLDALLRHLGEDAGRVGAEG